MDFFSIIRKHLKKNKYNPSNILLNKSLEGGRVVIEKTLEAVQYASSECIIFARNALVI